MSEFTVLDKFPPTLAARVQAKGFTPIECTCSEVFAWHESRGTAVQCPRCKVTGDVELKAVPYTPEPD